MTAEKASLEAKVGTLEEEIERKETKLKSRSGTITELMSKVEVERNSYEISLQGEFNLDFLGKTELG